MRWPPIPISAARTTSGRWQWRAGLKAAPRRAGSRGGPTTSRRADLHRYKGEPYAVAADVYSQPPHVGRVGWTWYTGAAGWLYRAGLESILGFRKLGSALCINPCIPREWKRFETTYRHGGSLYRIRVENPNGVCRGVSRVSLDGSLLSGGALLPLSDGGSEHCVEGVLG